MISKFLIVGSLISVFASHPAYAKEPRVTQFNGYSVTISVRVTNSGPDQAAAEERAKFVCASVDKKPKLEYSY